MATRQLDPAKLKETQSLVGGYTTGLFQSGIIYLGQTLGLFKALAGGEPATAGELGARLGLSERLLEEWLRAAAGGKLIEYAGDGRFASTPETDYLLADDTNLASVQWFFVNLPHRVKLWGAVPESFRTGLGMGWDERGPEAVEMMEVGFKAWYEQMLVQQAVPALEGLGAALERGIKVADIGCGAGIAIRELARAFPNSEFHGYDVSRAALERAAMNTTGLSNVHFHRVPEELLPGDGSFGLVTTFDCMHDMTDPYSVASAIRAALTPDGRWFIADIRSFPTFEENLANNPASARFYAVSLFGCLQSALSEPGGAGLGTFGLPEPKMRDLAEGAGFTRFRTVDLPSPVNAYYEARP